MMLLTIGSHETHPGNHVYINWNLKHQIMFMCVGRYFLYIVIFLHKAIEINKV